jgi:xanthine dehydrogenase YagR molybdenum-binding subunit
MAEYSWPKREDTVLLGKPINRLDGVEKTTGTAKYTYDINLKNQLIAQALGCPHGHCKIRSIDTSAAEKTPGVVKVEILPHARPGSEITFAGELLVVVAAESEAAAAEGVKALKVDYEVLDSWIDSEDLAGAEKAGMTAPAGGKAETAREPGDGEDEDEFIDKEIERLLKEAKHVVEGYYGIDAITHCCLEPHGSTVTWEDGKLKAYLSTQNVSGTDDGFARDLELTADDVEVICQYIGGGFGSKFAPDYWAISAARISRETGRPVKFMLTRDQELKIAGNRPSGYLKVRLGADEKGLVQVWDSQQWGTSGDNGGGVSHGVIPYVLVPKNYRRVATGIKTNTARSRAWRAPNHPQGCAISQTAYDDLARVMGADSYDIFMTNLVNAQGAKPEVYAEEMKVGAKLIDWKAKWHAHGKGPKRGSVVDGLGMALHTWGGGANASSCRLRIYPDGGVEASCGTQDLGTGTRTVCAQVLGETLGLTPEQMTINIGSSKYPPSGASGGSTTVGAVSESFRRAGQDALEQIFALAAKELMTEPENLAAKDGKIQLKDGSKSITWKKACTLLGTSLGMKPLEVTSEYARGTPSPLSSSGVGGVQMAHVEVDTETGVVRMKKYVAVQDQGLVINPKTCKSQIYGAAIMGIAYALFEHRIMDSMTGDFANAGSFENYKLAKLGDIGEIVVELYEPESERSRGVIGNGEPPVISPGAAISNAVCNALGVRVPVLPLTPKRVLEAIQKARA